MKALILVLLLGACGTDCRSKCEKAGGHVVEFDCHDEMMPIITTDANGMTNVSIMFMRSCSHRCEGASAEMPE